MNVTDKVAEVATTTVEALKQTPLVLALVIFNLIFMGLTAYISMTNGARWDEEITRMHDLVAKVMASCGPK